MASGDTLLTFTPLSNEAPNAAFATLDVRNGHSVLDFDAAIDEEAVFGGVLPRHYSGLGITVRLAWMASSAVAGTCRWQGAFERHDDEGSDLDLDSFAAFQSAGASAPATSGAVQYTDMVFADGAQIDGLLATESFRFKLRRDADGTSGTDDMVGDAELLRIEFRES